MDLTKSFDLNEIFSTIFMDHYHMENYLNGFDYCDSDVDCVVDDLDDGCKEIIPFLRKSEVGLNTVFSCDGHGDHPKLTGSAAHIAFTVANPEALLALGLLTVKINSLLSEYTSKISNHLQLKAVRLVDLKCLDPKQEINLKGGGIKKRTVVFMRFELQLIKPETVFGYITEDLKNDPEILKVLKISI